MSRSFPFYGRQRGLTRVVTLAAVSVVLAGTAAGARQVYRAQSDLVVLQVGAYDRRLLAVTDLKLRDFRVYEDNVPQEVRFFVSEDRPVAIGLVVDNSASMRTKREDVVAAADSFARSCNPDDALFTVNFNERVWFGLPPETPFTSDLAALHDALLHLTARGLTAMYDGIETALDHVAESPLEGRVVIVVSDGGDNGSHVTLDAVLRRAGRSNVTIYTVGLFDQFATGDDRHALAQLAEATGGLAQFPRTPRETQEALDNIARDVRHRYILGYESSNARREPAFRKIRVTAFDPTTHEPLKTRTRPGYFASSRRPVP